MVLFLVSVLWSGRSLTYVVYTGLPCPGPHRGPATKRATHGWGQGSGLH